MKISSQSNEITMTTAAPGNFNGVMPEFGRARDVQNFYGVKKGLLYLLCAEGKIKSVLIRRRGNVHGTRYFSMPSVAAYMNGLMDEQVQEKNNNLSGPAGSGLDRGHGNKSQSSGTKNCPAQQAGANNK